MLWHNDGALANDKKVGPLGTDFDCKPCKCCGSQPIRVDYEFDVSKERIKTIVRGESKFVNRERRSYYHCVCGECTTDWCRPVRDRHGVITEPAWQVARSMYNKGVFVGSKKKKGGK